MNDIQVMSLTTIRPYITVKSPVNGLNFYHYLHIKGGAGGFYRRDLGGEFDFILYYSSPDQDEKMGDICPRIACRELNIPCGEGSTIEEAHEDFLKKLKKNPIK
jgi:hypothetical protein